jgi:antitoxin component YwqK of YwqJK toxin-antitoxin module
MVLMCLCLTGVHGAEYEWTNKQGKTIKAEFISATNEAVTMSMQGKTYEVKLADLSPQSRALATKLRVQKSTVQKPGTNVLVEAPKVVVDLDQLEPRDDLMYFKEKPFTGVGVRKYPNGKKEGEFPFKDGKAHGLLTGWYENGKKHSEATLKDGKRHGLFTQWYENGQKKEEGTFKDGKLISDKSWDEDGNPLGQEQEGKAPPAKGVVDDSEVADEIQKALDELHRETELYTGTRIGYYEDGSKKSETPYVNDERHGTEIWYNEDGSKKSETPYVKGKRHGTGIWYDEDGSKSETPYVDGEPHGTAISYYLDGSKSHETPWVNGKLHGTEISYNEDGSKDMETPYVNNAKHGTEIEYRSDGSKFSESVWKNGKIISRKDF